MDLWSFFVWLHVLAGIAWVGLVWYLSMLQAPALARAGIQGDEQAAAAINRLITPRVMAWILWSPVLTWLSGVVTLEVMHVGAGSGVLAAFMLAPDLRVLGIGAWLGTIMLANPWLLIWPAQKRLLAMTPTTDVGGKAGVRRRLLLLSRLNVALSLPMLICMGGHGHGLPF